MINCGNIYKGKVEKKLFSVPGQDTKPYIASIGLVTARTFFGLMPK